MKKIHFSLIVMTLLLVGCDIKPSVGVLSSLPISKESSTTNNTDTSSSFSSINNSTSNSSSSASINSSTSTTSSNSSSSSSLSTSSSSSTSSYNNYYKNIDFSLSKAALKTSLFKLISKHEDHGYDGLKDAYKTTDTREDGTIWDMYSNEHYKFTTNMSGGFPKEGAGYNREHTIPQSIFNKSSPMRNDAFHVYPTDGYVNNRRGNLPHAEVGSASYISKNGTKVGTSSVSGVSGNVCEVIDEYKGDFARTYFYFVTCYEDKMSSFKTFATFSKNSYPSLSSWAINLYKKWSKEDPVSEKEIKRCQAVYEYQGNRNPFIDFPGLEDKIW